MRKAVSTICAAAMLTAVCTSITSFAESSTAEYMGNVFTYHISRWGAVVDSVTVNDANGAVTIPAELGGIETDDVADGAFGDSADKVTSLTIECDADKLNFSGLKSLKSVTLGENTVTIGKGCFSGCRSLRDVSISDTVTKIDIGAFSNCTELESISIPDSVEVICDEAFSGCSELAKVDWSMRDIVGLNVFKSTKYLSAQPDGMLILNNGKSLYCAAEDIKTADIPESVTYIYQFAFENTAVEKITVPKSISVIHQNAFNGAKKLKEMEFKGNINKFETAAFQDCSSLAELTIPEGITELPELCFSGCTGIKTISIPDSVKVIGDYAFQSCKGLESISFPNSLEVIDADAFERCSALKEVRLPESVTRVGERAFNECTKLSVLEVPGRTVIEDAAFCNTALTESNITLGSGVRYTAAEKNKHYENDPLSFLYKDNSAKAEPVYSTPKPRTTETHIVEVRRTQPPTEMTAPAPAEVTEKADNSDTIDVRSGDIITVELNREPVTFPDAQPFIDENGRTKIPIRAVAEGLGCEVDWDDATRTAVIKRANDVVYITIGKDTLQVGNKTVQMDTAAEIKDERTYIPIRFVGEALDLTVNWISN